MAKKLMTGGGGHGGVAHSIRGMKQNMMRDQEDQDVRMPPRMPMKHPMMRTNMNLRAERKRKGG